MARRIVVAKELCIGCRICEIMCTLSHEEKVINPRKARIRVFTDDLNKTSFPLVCNQCLDTPCMETCPSGAIEIDDDLKIPLVRQDRCIGCRRCVEICPSEAMFFDPATKTAMKCDLCGGTPQCVEYCPVLAHVGKKALSYDQGCQPFHGSQEM